MRKLKLILLLLLIHYLLLSVVFQDLTFARRIRGVNLNINTQEDQNENGNYAIPQKLPYSLLNLPSLIKYGSFVNNVKVFI